MCYWYKWLKIINVIWVVYVMDYNYLFEKINVSKITGDGMWVFIRVSMWVNA